MLMKEIYLQMNKKVTYLPHIKRRLQRKFAQISDCITDGKIEEALSYIDTLLTHEYKREQLYVKKLYCLSELERWQTVEQLAEFLRSEMNNSQFDLYYLLSLFKQEQYELVIDFFNESINNKHISENTYKEMKHVYEESKHIINDKASTINKRLQLAIVSHNGREQWLLFHQWDKLNVKPPELFYYMLQEERVNPIVKTYILQTLQKWKEMREVTVTKAGQSQSVKLNELPRLHNHPVYLSTLKRIELIEQSNPTLHTLVLELLKRYVELLYPFLYEGEEVKYVSEAVITLARNHLEGTHINRQEISSKTMYFMEQIRDSNEAYFQLTIT